jgi:methyl-accepting chemotaxis protein
MAALGTIGASINVVLEYVTATADAVEVQSVVTSEISSAMQTSAGSVAEMNDNMIELTAAVRHVSQSFSNTRHAAQVLVR